MRHSLLANDSEQNLSFCNDEQFQKEQDEQVNSKFAIEDTLTGADEKEENELFSKDFALAVAVSPLLV